MSALSAFHFLRPEWLWLLLPAVLFPFWLLRARDPSRALRAAIDPLLLDHLALDGGTERGKLRPAGLLAAAWLLGVLALAGPSWQKEPAPFGEDRSALFVVTKVTPTMLARDVQPSRLERSVQKIGDLLERRAGTSTGLVAYAGTPHLVMPLTSDSDVIRYFAAALAPEIMPNAGDDPAAALELAARRLSRSGLPGSILLVADRVDAVALRGIEAVHAEYGFSIHVYALAAGPDVIPAPGGPPAPFLDEDAMKAAAKAGGGALVTVTPDDRDLDQLDGRVSRSIANSPAGTDERWKDGGYLLLWPLALVLLLFVRRGGAVPMGSGT
jgi:Ca-activated chloride channel family protein